DIADGVDGHPPHSGQVDAEVGNVPVARRLQDHRDPLRRWSGQTERYGDVQPVDEVMAERSDRTAAGWAPRVLDVAPPQLHQPLIGPLRGRRPGVTVGVPVEVEPGAGHPEQEAARTRGPAS